MFMVLCPKERAEVPLKLTLKLKLHGPELHKRRQAR